MPNDSDSNLLLKVEGLDLFDPLRKMLLRKVSFHVQKGEALHIVGENGVGKTTLIRAVFSDYKYYKGSIKLGAKDFSYLPQLSPKKPKLPINLGEICDKEYEFFTSKLMKRSLGGASGGERKRAMLAKIFTEDRPLIVLDEPLNHLDSAASAQVGDWLSGYLKSGGALIYTGHIGNLPQTKILDLEQWRC